MFLSRVAASKFPANTRNVARSLKQRTPIKVVRGFSSLPDIKDHDFTATDTQVAEINKTHRGKLEIKNNDAHGRGVFAAKKYQPGDLLMSSEALKVTTVRDSHTIQKGWDKHIVMDLPAIMINHSCSANVGLKDNLKGAYDFFALREIKEGEELLWDYETSESEIEGFPCYCGSDKCRHTLKGFRHHGKIVREQYGEEFIANYLKE